MEPKQEIINHALSRGPPWPTQIHSFSAAVEDGGRYSALQFSSFSHNNEPVLNVRSHSKALVHIPLVGSVGPFNSITHTVKNLQPVTEIASYTRDTTGFAASAQLILDDRALHQSPQSKPARPARQRTNPLVSQR